MKIEQTHHALTEFTRKQGDKIDELTDDVHLLTNALAQALGVTVDEVKANKEEILEGLRGRVREKISDYIRKKTSAPSNEPESADGTAPGED